MKNVGLFSGGFFYKNIDRFQYKQEGEITDPQNPYFSEGDKQYKLIQQRNGKAAQVYGVEVNFNTTLSFMPWIFKNLVFTSNYTYVQSKAVTDEARGDLRLPGQADHTVNLALAYSSKRLTLQASANYNGSFIAALGLNAEEDIWVNERWQIDLNGSFKLTKNLNVYAEATNIFNSPTFSYFGQKTRVYDLQFTSAFVRFGMSYKF